MARHRRRDSAFAVMVCRGRVLLVQSAAGRWQLPGGGLEKGERHWEAVRREIREETGLRAEVLGLTGIYARSDGSRAVVFAAHVRRRDARRLPGPRNEIAQQRWVRVTKAHALLRPKTFRRLCDALASPRAFARRRSHVARWRRALG